VVKEGVLKVHAVSKAQVCLNELSDESLESDKIDVGVRVEKLKLDL
jgi:hypothetical protein